MKKSGKLPQNSNLKQQTAAAGREIISIAKEISLLKGDDSRVLLLTKRLEAANDAYQQLITELETENAKLSELLQNCRLAESSEYTKDEAGYLPLCSHCKNIRDEKGYWTELEHYLTEHYGTRFSHSLCPNCVEKLYPEYYKKVNIT